MLGNFGWEGGFNDEDESGSSDAGIHLGFMINDRIGK